MSDLTELRRAVIAGCGGGAMLYDKATALVDELIAAASASSTQAGSDWDPLHSYERYRLPVEHGDQIHIPVHKHVGKSVSGDCPHADWLTAECEGWENPAEPLSIRVTCSRCGRHIDVRVEDPSLLDWEEGP